MNWLIKNRIDDTKFIEICKNSLSMAEASSKLKLHFNSFKKRALELNCYFPNPSGKGMTKKFKEKIPLQEILEGKHPSYSTYKLKNKLLKAGIFENKCSNQECKVFDEWLGKKINCELDHIDGDKTNHSLKNLRMLCPNCHSQTSTYRSKVRNL